MKLTLTKKDLVRSLSRIHSVVDRKSPMPILSNVLLSCEAPTALRFAATDLHLSVSSICSAQVVAAGATALPARTLFDIAKNLPEGEVSLKALDNHSLEIRAGRARFKIPSLPGHDFPTLPSPGSLELSQLEAEGLGRLIALTHYSMSGDDTRPHLAGALLEGDGKLVRMVTTDGHRLSKAEHKQQVGGKLLNFHMLVPAKGINELRKLIDEVKSSGAKGEDGPVTIGVTSSAGNAFFLYGDIVLSVKLADEQFPPYSKVIPKTAQRRVTLGRYVLIDALKRIGLVANDKSGAVRFFLEPGLLRITSENPDVGEGSEELDVDFAGESAEIGFNVRYLLDALGALTEDEVMLELGGALDPGVIKPVGPTDFIGVVMPMRV